MEITNLYNLRESLASEGILICFAGPFSHSVIEELGDAVKRHLEEAQLTRASLMDVFSVFIEQTQNVRNYADAKTIAGILDHDFNSGIVVIARKGDRHVISSGNIVDRDDIHQATEKLDWLRGLDKQGLKAAYKEQLRRDQEPGKGGGLGLIEMSRKTSEPLEYSLRDIDKRYCFFSLKATV